MKHRTWHQGIYLSVVKTKDLNDIHNGNFLGTLELLSCYDPLLNEHLQTIRDRLTHYLSSDIQNYFIELCGRGVLKIILKDREDAIYYSVICDAVPDISHTEQNVALIRNVRNRWLGDHWTISWIQELSQKDRKWDSRDDWKRASWPRDRHRRWQRAGIWQQGKYVRESQGSPSPNMKEKSSDYILSLCLPYLKCCRWSCCKVKPRSINIFWLHQSPLHTC